MRIGFVLLLLPGILIPGLAQGGIVLGTLTASEYEAMNQSGRYAWLQGAVDGMLVEAAFNAASKKNQTTWIGECVRGKSFLQMKAMMEKELKANPEHWEKQAALFLWSILSKTCKGNLQQ